MVSGEPHSSLFRLVRRVHSHCEQFLPFRNLLKIVELSDAVMAHTASINRRYSLAALLPKSIVFLCPPGVGKRPRYS